MAVDPLPRRRELACSVGADLAFEPGSSLAKQAAEWTEGKGADIAIEISGNPSALDMAINLVRFQGTVVAASWYGTKPVTLQLGGAFHRRRVRIVSSQVGHVDPDLAPTWTRERRTAEAVHLLSKIVWQPLITHRFRLDQAGDAYRLLDQHAEECVQAVFKYV
jgi:alcohol dehydrogenase